MQPGRILQATALAAALTLGSMPSTTPASARHTSTNTCFGTLTITPKRVHVGQNIHIRGTHFSCLSPENKLFPTYSLFLYQYTKTGGFHIYTIHVDARGDSQATRPIPSKLLANSTVLSGKQRSIVTRPGTYYLSIRLFDVGLDPPKQALAKITILG